jgi:hypothetical protein
MKLALLTAALLLPAWGQGNAELAQIEKVYMLSMGNGLDQYLANHITAQNLFQVVTDPSKADAIFSDQIGAGFEQRLKDLFPPDPPPKKEEEEEKKPEGTLGANPYIIPPSSFSRGKGNIFLIDLKSRRVLWSIFERPRNTTPEQLNKLSEKIVQRLRKEMKGK